MPVVDLPVTTISPPSKNQNTVIQPTRKSTRNKNKPARFRVSSAKYMNIFPSDFLLIKTKLV